MHLEALPPSHTPDLGVSARHTGCRHDGITTEPWLVRKSIEFLMMGAPLLRDHGAGKELCRVQSRAKLLRSADLLDQDFKTKGAIKVGSGPTVTPLDHRSGFFIKFGG